MSEPPWILPYLYPFVGGWSAQTFVGPPWYWNPWQWPLNAWPNLLLTLLFFAGWVYIGVRLDRTWFEFIWPRMDLEVCRVLRKYCGGTASEAWSPTEARVIRRSYVAVCVAALLACVLAAANAKPEGEAASALGWMVDQTKLAKQGTSEGFAAPAACGIVAGITAGEREDKACL